MLGQDNMWMMAMKYTGCNYDPVPSAWLKKDLERSYCLHNYECEISK